MAVALEQKNGLQEHLSTPKTNVLESVLNRIRANHIRREIGIIALSSHRDNLISDEVYEGYRELAEGRDGYEISVAMLEGMRNFAKEHEARAIRIHQKIQTAIQKQIASENDEAFLMEELVIDNEKFVSQAGVIESLIDAKLMRMQKDRERYDKLAHHKLIGPSGQLNIDSNGKIDFPDENTFLQMTVPERRELLKKCEEALPKAEAYAEMIAEGESGKRVEAYVKKLDKAAKAGIIGEHTCNSFLSEFMELGSEKEQERWDKEFDTQMKRYKVLWDGIRGTLKGRALETMEGMIDEHGYADLFKTFGLIKASESKRLVASYAGALEEHRKAGTIGRHTMTQFMLWMNQRDLADQYEAENLLPDQMKRYETLWEDIAQLGGKEQKLLRSKIDVWGYTELKRQCDAFRGRGVKSGKESDRMLGQIESSEVREAIADASDLLEEQGGNKRKSFLGILSHMFNRSNRSTFDATSFETEIRERVVKENPQIKRDLKGRGANDEVDYYQIDEDTEILEDTGRADITEVNGFTQVSAENDNGTVHRETQVTINEEEGMRRLFMEEGKHSFSAEEAGGNDDMSLAVSNGGRTVELNLKEIRLTQEYLKLKERETPEASEKAA